LENTKKDLGEDGIGIQSDAYLSPMMSKAPTHLRKVGEHKKGLGRRWNWDSI
jgi:hypothetical protein